VTVKAGQLLTARRAAQIVALPRSAVLTALASGELAARFVSRVWIIDRADLEVWAARRLAARGGKPELRGRPRRLPILTTSPSNG
jgi:hypothetical protein